MQRDIAHCLKLKSKPGERTHINRNKAAKIGMDETA